MRKNYKKAVVHALQLLLIVAVWQLPNVMMGLSKNVMMGEDVVFASEGYALPSGVDWDQSLSNFTLKNDTAYTSPVQKVRVNVILNDVIPCVDYTVDIVTPPASGQGTVAVSGNYIEFTPAAGFYGQWINIPYSITCESTTENATLSIFISEYSAPLNVVPSTTECIEIMPEGVAFDVRQKFNTNSITNGYLQLLQIPLVGDLDGDGKPEIVVLRANGHGLGSDVTSLCIFDGQDGSEILNFTLSSLGSQYGGASNFTLHYYHQSPSHMVIADVDRDGIVEIILCQTENEGRIYCLKPVLNANERITGLTKVWDGEYGFKAPLSLSDRYFGSPIPQIMDMNGDGIPEVVVYNKIYNAQTGKLLMAWSGSASTAAASTLAANTGLEDYERDNGFTSGSSASTNSNAIRARAMVGRRPAGIDRLSDAFMPVSAIVDLDNDGIMEIATGARVHKFNFNYFGKAGEVGSHTANTYTTIDAPTSISLKTGTSNLTDKTYFLNDGFTRVADIDGDNKLDIVVYQFDGTGVTYSARDILMYVWDWETRTVKAASSIHTGTGNGPGGIPFIGDINDRLDGRDNSGSFTKKLPEIVFCMGGLNATSAAGRTGSPLHPASSGTGFNQNPSGTYHVVAFTYDGGETEIWKRLKLSWILGTADDSKSTGITMFDFNNDGAFDLCYRDINTLRVLSPKLGTSDYVPVGATPQNNPAVLFSTACISYTGYEAPAIADINMDGSADIVVAGHTSSQTQADIFAFEYMTGGQKWAPAPPVWNQALYNPLYVNEDLSIPARPQSMLTKYYNGTDSIQPFNGVWIQQPIVQEGRDYKPVYRIPDAMITDMSINAQSTDSAVVTVTIYNKGTASLNANTPVAFYRTITGDRSLATATLITPNTYILGRDIFPNEEVSLTFNLSGNYDEVTVWMQIMDDGNKVLAANYSDCNFEDNALQAIDCPTVKYQVNSDPGTVLCGPFGVVMLTAEPTPGSQRRAAYQQYQWYNGYTRLVGDTFQTYLATQPGAYRCFVTDSICVGYTVNTVTLTRSNSSAEKPRLSSVPGNITKICGESGSVYLQVDNYMEESSALYTWFKDGEKISDESLFPYYTVTEPGLYQAVVVLGSCAYTSDTLRINQDNEHPITRPKLENLYDNIICNTGGRTVLRVNTPEHVDGYTYQWFRNSIPLAGDTLRWYIPTDAGQYSLLMTDGTDCSTFSDTITISKSQGTTVTVPVISKSPDKDSICIDGGLLMSASTYLTSVTYTWYKNGIAVQSGTNRYYSVTEEGYYFVVVRDGACVSVSSQQYIHTSTQSADVVDIESCTGLFELCGSNSALILRVKLDQMTSTQTYLWMKDNQPLSGETYSSIIVKAGGTYKLFVIDGNCAYFTDSITVRQGDNTSFIAPILETDPANNTLCGPGSSVLLYVTNTEQYAGNNPRYDWYKDRQLVQSGTLSTFFATEPGEYFVRVVDYTVECAAVSGFVTIRNSSPAQTIDKPYIESISGTTVICGDNGVVILQMKQNLSQYTNNVTYQWFKDGHPLTVNANKNLIRVSDTGSYYLRVIDGACSILSDTITVTPEVDGLDAVSFERSPATGQICADGGNIYLYVENTANYTNPKYVWLRNDTVIHSSDTGFYYEADQAGNYSVLVVSGDCSVESRHISLQKSITPVPTPVIASETGSTSICAPSGTVVLKLSNASDFSGITSYQWFKNGQPLAGENGNSIICMLKDTGEYRLQVVEDLCSAISGSLKVKSDGGSVAHALPVLVFDPGLDMCNAGTTQIKVSNASDFPGAIYVWYHNRDSVKEGYDSVYYATQTGTYMVLASYNGCSYLSPDSVIMRRNENILSPEIAIEPASKAICGDNGAVIIRLANVVSFDQQGATYQWYKNDVAIAGETASALVVDTSLGAGRYRIRIQEEDGCVTYGREDNITYTTGSITKPVITPLTGTIYRGSVDNITITVSNVDNSATAYIWYNDNGFIRRDNHSGGTISYSATAPGNYFVQVVYGSPTTTCAAVSEKSVITIADAYADKPELNVLPESREICAVDGMATIEIVNLNAYTNPTFYWYDVNTNNVVGRASSLLVSDTGKFRVQVWDFRNAPDSIAAIPSDTVHIIRNTTNDTIFKPVITNSGSKICGTNGRVILYEATYADKYSPAAQYRWLRNGREVQYTTTPSYEASVAGTYILQVVDGACFSQSDPVIINSENGSNTKPAISILGGNLQVCGPDGLVILRLNNSTSFAGATFQWYKNNFPLAGETDTLLRVTSANTSSEDNYRIEVKFQDDCTSLSEPQLVRFYGLVSAIKPVLTRRPAGGELCGEDGSLVLYVSNAGQYSQGATFYWFNNYAQIIKQGNSSTLIVSDSGIYTVYVIDGSCSSESLPDTIRKKVGGDIQRPDIDAVNGSALCAGDSRTLLMMTTDASLYGSGVKYQWYMGDDTLAGANLPRLTVDQVGIYYLQVMDGSCSSISDSVQVSVGGIANVALPSIDAIPANMDICEEGGRILLKVTNTNQFAGGTYIWYNGNLEVSRGVGLSYHYADSVGSYYVQIITAGGCHTVSDELFIDSSSTEIALPKMRTIPENNIICTNNGRIVIALTNPHDYIGASYHWLKDNDTIAGEKGIVSSSYPELFLTVNSAGSYRIRIIDGSCVTYSDPVDISSVQGGFMVLPAIVKVPDYDTICGEEGSIMLSERDYFNDAPGTRYVWYQDDRIVQDSTLYYYAAVGGAGAGTYYLQKISPDGCSALAGPLVLGYKTEDPIAKPQVTTFPSSDTICGTYGVVSLRLSNRENYPSSNLTFQWYKNNIAIPGAQSDNYNYRAQDSGSYSLQVIVSGECASMSDPISIRKIASDMQQPVLTMDQSDLICGEFGSVVFRINNVMPFAMGSIYTWYRGDTIVAEGMDMKSYEATAVGTYYVQVTDGSCATLSTGYTLHYNNFEVLKPIVEAIPVTAELCGKDGTVELTFTNYNSFSGGYTIQWYKDNSPLAPTVGTRRYYANTEGSYRVKASIANCAAFSIPIDVKVSSSGDTIVKPVITTKPDNAQTVCDNGGRVLMMISNTTYAQGAEFVWYHGTNIVQRSTSNTYMADTAGTYYVMVLEGNCASISNNVVLGRFIGTIAPPVVVSLSGNDSICTGGSLVLGITNQYSTNATYEWLKNDVTIAGKTDPTLVVTEAGKYRVVVFDGSCSSISDPAFEVKLKAQSINKPLVAKIPYSDSICQNGDIQMEVVNTSANYSSLATYIWYKDGYQMQSGTDAFFITRDEGRYYVQVIDGSCSSTSDEDTLYMSTKQIYPPEFNYFPQSLTICGDTGVVVLQINNTSNYSSAVTYQWYKNDTLLPDETKTVLSIKASGDYSVRIIDGECAVTSTAIHVDKVNTIINKPVLDIWPINAMIIGSDSVEMVLENASQYTNPIGIWFRGTDTIAMGLEYHAGDTGTYRLLVIEGNCAAWSDPVVVRFDGCRIAPPRIASIPASEKICEDDGSALLYLLNDVSDYIAPTYQWYYNGSEIIGSTQSTYETTVAGSYSLMITDNGCNRQSAVITLKVEPTNIAEPVITKRPEADSLCGENGRIILELSNPEEYASTASYQWMKDNYAIAGATEKIYEVTEPGAYRIVVQEGDCAAFSEIDTIVLNTGKTIAIPNLTRLPENDSICIGGNIRFEVSNANSYTAPTFVWYRADSVIQNGTDAHYIATQAGRYFVQVIDGVCSSTSRKDTLYMSTSSDIDDPKLSYYPQSQIICGDTGVVVMIVTNVGDYTNPSYQWYRDGEKLANDTTSIYSAKVAGDYYVQIVDGNCGVISTVLNVKKNTTIINTPRLTVIPSDGMIQNNIPVSMTLANQGVYNSPIGIWYRGTDSVATGLSYAASVSGDYRLLIIDGSCAAWSETVTVSVGTCTMDKPRIASIPVSAKLCQNGGGVLLYVTNENSYTSPQYQWYRNDTVIANATDKTYEALRSGKYKLLVVVSDCRDYSLETIDVEIENTNIVEPAIIKRSGMDSLCGENGRIILELSNSEDYASTASYQWMKDNYAIAGATEKIYEVTEQGIYRLVVQEGDCAAFSEIDTIGFSAGKTIAIPNLTKLPENDSICIDGSVRFEVSNANVYTSPMFVWYRADSVIQNGTKAHYIATQAGRYFVQVIDGGCSSTSRKDTLYMSTTSSIIVPQLAHYPQSLIICGDTGVVVMKIKDTTIYTNNATYQWYRNGEAISNATDILYSAKDSGLYYVQILDGDCGVISTILDVKKNNTTIITPRLYVNPNHAMIQNGIPVELSLDNDPSDYSNPRYIWFRGTDSIANTADYSVNIDGAYRLLVLDGNCAAWSRTVDVTIDGCTLTTAVISSRPISEKVCTDGGSVLLYVTNDTSYIAPTYEWIFNGSRTGIYGKTYETTIAGTYSIIVEDEGCSKGSNEIIVAPATTDIMKPVITKRPDSDTLCGNDGSIILELSNNVYSLSATYQWLKDNYAIEGATGKIYEVTEPGYYRLSVEDGTCGTLSTIDTIVLDINKSIAKPEYEKVPNESTICQDGSIRYDIANIGLYTNPTYVWYRGNDVVQTDVKPYYIATQSGKYFVQVIEGNCSATSDRDSLSMSTTSSIATPQLTYYPQSLTICGDTGVVVMKVKNSGAYTNATYQWYRNGNMLTDATSAMYSAKEAGNYYVQIFEGSCAVISDPLLNVIKNTTMIVKASISISSANTQITGGYPVSLKLDNDASDYTNPTYIWFRGLDSVGTTNTFDANVTGTYQLLVIDNSCAVWSNAITVTDADCEPPVPAITSVPSDAICGDDGRVLLQVSDRSIYVSPSYQWYDGNDNPITGATSPALEIMSAGTYKLSVTDTGCVAFSALVTINSGSGSIDKPAVSKTPDTDSLCGNNGTIILEIANRNTYGGSVAYQWLQDNYEITGATNANFEVTQPGNYRLMVQEGGCMSLSDVIIIGRNYEHIYKPRISKIPDSKTICQNGSVRYTVDNTTQYSSNVVYNWYKESSCVQSGNNPVYFATSAGIYYVQAVDGSCGATSVRDTIITSLSASIDPVAIAIYPSTNNICGDTGVVVMNVTNAGSYSNATYQWYLNGKEIAGATESMYSAKDSGTYYVFIVAGQCAVKSADVPVTKTNTTIATPRLYVNPSHATIKGDVPVELSLDNPSAFVNPSYIWFRGTDSVANTADYIATEEGYYSLLVLEGGCAALSTIVNVTIDGCTLTTASISSIPTSMKACTDGGSVLMYINNDADYVAPKYEWVYNGYRTGIYGKTYETTIAGTYSVIVDDEGCSKGSNNIEVTTESTNITKPGVTQRPDTDTLCGNNGSIILELSNPTAYIPTATYQWMKDNYAIEGATGKIYEVKESGNYRIVVLEGNCAAFSTIDTIVRNPNKGIDIPSLTKSPDKNTICVDGSIRYEVLNVGDYTSPTFVWYRGDDVVQNGTSANYIATQSGKYFVQVIEGTCSATSNRDSLSMSTTSSIATPQLTYYPQSLTICGDTGIVVMKVKNSGAYTNPTYQWYRNGEKITTNGTSVLYSAKEAGDYYVQISEGDCGVISSVLNVMKNNTTIATAYISAFPTNAQITGGNPVSLKLDNPLSYSNSVSYIWYRDSDSVGTTANYDANVTGAYRLLVIDGSCATWSNTIQVTDANCAPPAPTITTVPSSSICGVDGRVLLQVSDRSIYVSPLYQWYDGNNVAISGATDPTLEVLDAGTYKLEVIDTGCMIYSSDIVITPDGVETINKPVVTKLPDVKELCGTNGRIILGLSNPEVYASSATYQWLNDNYEIQGATDIIYEVSTPGRYRLMIREGNCMSLSDIDTITPNSSLIAIPDITKVPYNDTLCVGGSIRYSVVNYGYYSIANTTYAWYKDNMVVQNSASRHYVAEAAGVYFVQVMDGNCSSTSRRDTLYMSTTHSITAPVVSTYPSSNAICGDKGVVVLRVMNKDIYVNPTYVWYKNGESIPNSNTPMYSAKDSGSYFVQVFEGECAAISSPAISVSKLSTDMVPLQLSYNPTSKRIVSGIPVVITLDNTADYPSAQYIWFKGNDSIAVGMSSYSADTAGTYKLLVVDGSCAIWSEDAVINQDTCNFIPTAITSTPSSLTVCGNNGSVLMTVTNKSAYAAPVTYAWYRNDTLVSGATKSFYAAKQAGSYKVFIKDGLCAGYSEPIVIDKDNSIIAPCTTRMTPSSGIICGDTGSVMLILTNIGNYSTSATYQWYKDGLPLSGATSSTKEVFESGTYMIQVVDGTCAVVSDTFRVMKNTISDIYKPLISASGMKICGANGRVLLSVTNANKYSSNISYQWFRNNLLIGGATQSTYEVTIASTYRVQIVDGSCGAFSDTINIAGDPGAVIAFPKVDTVPSNAQVCRPNGSVLLRLTNDTAYTNPVYQWYNQNVAIDGATESSYEALDRGSYSIEVKEGDCTTLSTAISVGRSTGTIEKPVVSVIPSSKEICGGAGVSMLRLGNVYQYTTSATYQWYRNNAPIDGAMDTLYIAEEEGIYRIYVEDGGCGAFSVSDTIKSSASTITQPDIASFPLDGKIYNAKAVELYLQNTSDYSTNLSYYWMRGSSIVSTNAVLSTVEEGTYKLLLVDNNTCAGLSDTIRVEEADCQITQPQLDADPSLLNVCGNNGSVRLSINNASVYTDPVYQWFKDRDTIIGATSYFYIATEAGDYVLEVSDQNCKSYSVTKQITKDNTNIAIPSVSKSGTTICGEYGQVTLTLTNSGSYGTPVYQWYRNDTAISGATLSSYTAPIAGIYKLHVIDNSNECGVFSSEDTLKIDLNGIERPIVDMQPSSGGIGQVCGTDGNVQFTIANRSDYGSATTFAWYKDGIVVATNTSGTYITQSAGGYYVKVTEGNCSTVSDTNEVVTTINNIYPATISSLPRSNNICGANGVVVLSLDNKADYTNATYQWYKDSIAIANADSSVYHAKDAGLYYLQVIEGTCGVISNDVRLTKDNKFIAIPEIAKNPNLLEICEDGNILLSVTNTTAYTNPTYVWYRGTDTVQVSRYPSYTASVAGAYYVQVIEGGCSSVSSIDTLTMSTTQITPATISSHSNSNIVCGTYGVVILSLDNKTAYSSPRYQWYKNGVAIFDADSSVYHAKDSGLYYLHIIEGACATTSNGIRLMKDNSFIDKPLLSKIPNTLTICTDGEILLSVTNTTAYNNATYVWHKGTEIVQNSSLSTYRASVAGDYYVEVMEGACSSVSLTETLITSPTSIVPPAISSLPSSNKICGANGVVRLEVTNVSDYTNPMYQWYRDSIAISGATSVFYEVRTAGMYSIQVIDGSCSAFEDVKVDYDNTAINPPTIQSTSPNGQICGQYGSVMLSVSNSTIYAISAEYVWYRNNIEVQRSTSEVYVATQSGDYTVQVVDGNCSSISSITTLTPSPSSILQAQISPASGNTTLCGVNGVVVLGLDNENDFGNATYQWYKYGVAIPQATNPVYSVTDTGEYRLIVTEGSCTSVSNMIKVTRSASSIDVPVIASNPANGNIYGGAAVYLAIQNETQFSNPAYQWYRDSRYMVETEKDLSTNVAGKYRLLVIEGNNCSAWSNEITLQDTVCNVPVGLLIDTTICEGDTIDLFTYVTHLPTNVTAEFYRDMLGVSQLNSTIVSPNITTTYYVRFVDTLTTCMSSLYSLTITVNNGPTLTSGLHGGIICSGSLFGYMAVSSNPSVTYQWKRLPNPAINNGDSATGSTQAISEFLTNNSSSNVLVTYEFMLTTTDGSCPTASPVLVVVEVLPSGHTTIQTMNSVCYGDTMASISYQTQQTAAMYYKITYESSALGAGFVPMSQFELLPANQVNISLPSTAMPGTYAGTMEIRIGACTESHPFTIVVSTMPTITEMEKDAYFCEGNVMILTVQADGSNLSYQWYYEGNPIPGATSSTYTENSFLSSMEGRYYVVVSNSCASIASDTMEVFTNNTITLATKWEDIILVDGSGQDYVRYQWYKDGKPIGSQASEQYYVAPNGLVGTYHVRVFFADGSYIESCPVTLNTPKVVKNILYPSPVKNGKSYTIELIRTREEDQSSTVEVYDAAGRIVGRHIMEDNKINIQAMYAAGVYSVRIIRADGEVIVKRLIVE